MTDPEHSTDAPEATTPVTLIQGESLKDLMSVMNMLRDQIRLEVVDVLSREREVNVTNLIARTSAPSQPAISHHLAKLLEQDIVDVRRDGKHNFYSIHPGKKGQFARRIISAWRKAVSESQN